MNKYKLRRLFEQEFAKLNAELIQFANANGFIPFHLKYTPHFIDDLIKRDISYTAILNLLSKSKNHMDEISKFLALPYQPRMEEDKTPGVEYRPLRLELTDGELWIGLSSDKPFGQFFDNVVGMTCRMAIVNPVRLPSRISCTVIKCEDN